MVKITVTDEFKTSIPNQKKLRLFAHCEYARKEKRGRKREDVRKKKLSFFFFLSKRNKPNLSVGVVAEIEIVPSCPFLKEEKSQEKREKEDQKRKKRKRGREKKQQEKETFNNKINRPE